MINREFDLGGYFAAMYRRAPQALALVPDEDLPERQRALREALCDVLSLSLYGSRDTAPTAVRISCEQCEGYTREKLALTIADSLTVPLYILRPDGIAAPRAVCLALAGHGRGVCDIVNVPDVFGRPEGGPYQKGFAVELVKNGFIVAAPEIIGFGEARLYAPRFMDERGNGGDCAQIQGMSLHLGGCVGGLRVYQMQRVLDYVETLPEADASRIGCMGISGGGTVTTNLSAVDGRIAAAVVSGYANFYRTSILAMNHCVDNFFPGILQYAEMPDVLGLIAPRPLMISSGSEDHIFPVAATREACEYLRAIYAALGAEGNLETDYFEGGHMISGEALYGFLRRRLRP